MKLTRPLNPPLRILVFFSLFLLRITHLAQAPLEPSQCQPARTFYFIWLRPPAGDGKKANFSSRSLGRP